MDEILDAAKIYEEQGDRKWWFSASADRQEEKESNLWVDGGYRSVCCLGRMRLVTGERPPANCWAGYWQLLACN